MPWWPLMALGRPKMGAVRYSTPWPLALAASASDVLGCTAEHGMAHVGHFRLAACLLHASLS
jgi:hypothetical protein